MTRQAPLLIALAALLVGGGLGLWAGSSGPEPVAHGGANPEAALESVVAEVQSLSRSVEDLRAEVRAKIDRQLATGISSDTPSERRPATDASGVDDLRREVDRLADLIQSITTSVPHLSGEAIRLARIQHPTPNLGAVRELQSRLAADDQELLQTIKREWLLCGMDEVIRRLGCPSNILRIPSDAQSQSWEYIVPNGDTLVVRFASGLVVAVEN